MKASLALAVLLVSCASPPLTARPVTPKHQCRRFDEPPLPHVRVSPAEIPLAKFVPPEHVNGTISYTTDRRIEVVSVKGDLVVREAPPHASGDALPFPFCPDENDDGAWRGHAHVRALAGGWLIGFDTGEFGGGLYWFSHDGSSYRHLMKENVTGFTELGSQLLVVAGFRNNITDTGHLWIVDANADEASLFADLGGFSEAILHESPSSLVIMLTIGMSPPEMTASEALVRVAVDGKVTLLGRAPEWDPGPSESIAIDRNGVIATAGSPFVRLWHPRLDGTYEPELLALPECVKITCSETHECRCSGDK